MRKNIPSLCYLILVSLIFFSCKTTYNYSNFYCGASIGIYETDLNDISVQYIKKDSLEIFKYYQINVKKCPGYLSNGCTRFYNYYDSTLSSTFSNLNKDKSCFRLSNTQKVILDKRYYKSFVNMLPSSEIKSELNILIKNMDSISSNESVNLFLKKSTTDKILSISLENAYVYEFYVNIEILNYYFNQSGKIFNYNKTPQDKAIVILVFQK